MNRIVLIGNGFDLAHGLKTSYADFINWYWEDWGRRLLHGLNRTEDDGLCSFKIHDKIEVLNWASVFQGWYYKRENPLIPWETNDVVSLAKQDKKLCDFKMSPFFERIQNSIETKGWVDIENEYYSLLMKYAIDDYSEKSIKDLNLQLQFMQDKLIQYLSFINQVAVGVNDNILKKIYSPIDPKELSIEKLFQLREYIDWCVKQDNSYWENKMLRYGETFSSDYIDSYKMHYHENYYTGYPRPYMLPDHIMLLSFNYTRTAHLYHNQNFFLNYIHGELENPQNIIFGYGDEIDKNYQERKI